MGYKSDESTDISDSEIDEFEAQSYLDLKTRSVPVKIGDNFYKCPFCAGKKKLVYHYNDLLQHAIGVGESNRGPKVKARHRALTELLKTDLAVTGSQPFQAEVVQQPLYIARDEELIVWPWMGILVNIDAGARLKEYLATFHPLKITYIQHATLQRSGAIVNFGKDWNGYVNAMAFGSYYEDRHLGKKDWLENRHCSLNIFGWIARACDFNSEDCFGEHLRTKGDLKSVVGLAIEESCKMKKLVSHLANGIHPKREVELELDYLNGNMPVPVKDAPSHEAYGEDATDKLSSVIEQRPMDSVQGGEHIVCQICDMENHTARYCPHRFQHSHLQEEISHAIAAMSMGDPTEGALPQK